MERHPAGLKMAVPIGLTLLGLALPLSAQPPGVARENFQLFVLAGQSNMAGRGDIEPQDSVVHPRVWMLNRELQWVSAVEPMHFDKPMAAVGPGRSFGITIADADPTIHIGLVPTAVGGSSISAWTPGGLHAETGAFPWDEAIVRASAALQAGVLKGILWHQGETDSSSGAAPRYEENLRTLISRFRETLKDPEVPFLIGQLGRFPSAPWNASKIQVDAVHRSLPGQLPRVAFVSAEGLGDKGDALHFSAPAARELGRRYARAYQALMGTPAVPKSTPAAP